MQPVDTTKSRTKKKKKKNPGRQENSLEVCKMKKNWKSGWALEWPGVLRSTEKVFDATELTCVPNCLAQQLCKAVLMKFNHMQGLLPFLGGFAPP